MAEADLDLVLEWRNSERVRRAMYTDHLITPDEHRAWFRRVLDERSAMPFMFEYNGRPVGVVNVTAMDRRNGRCTWGFYIGAADAPRGTGSAMGFFALEHITGALGFRKVIGEALADNAESVKFHLRLGFVEEGRFREHVLKRGRYVDVISFALFSETWRSNRERLAAEFFSDASSPCRK